MNDELNSLVASYVIEKDIIEELAKDLRSFVSSNVKNTVVFKIQAYDFLEQDNENPSTNLLDFEIDLSQGIEIEKFQFSKYRKFEYTNVTVYVKPKLQKYLSQGAGEVCFFQMSYQYRDNKMCLLENEIFYDSPPFSF